MAGDERARKRRKRSASVQEPEPPPDAAIPHGERVLDEVLGILRVEDTPDFRQYRPSTLNRRILRRMQLLKSDTVEEYLRRLRTSEKERRTLAQEFLIGVTSFFRDAPSYEALARTAIPDILGRASDEPVRVWVPGCATGEEAYSLGMLFLETMEQRNDRRQLQVLATDVDRGRISFRLVS